MFLCVKINIKKWQNFAVNLKNLTAGCRADGPPPCEPFAWAVAGGETLAPLLGPLTLQTLAAKAHHSSPLLTRPAVSRTLKHTRKKMHKSVHCKKRLAVFPPPGCHLPNSPWPGRIKLFPARESLVCDITAGDGKLANLFLQCRTRSILQRSYFHRCKIDSTTPLASISNPLPAY